MKRHKTKYIKLAAALAVTLLGVSYLPSSAEAVYMRGPLWSGVGDRMRGHELHHWNLLVDDWYDWNDKKGDATFRLNIDAAIKVANDPSIGNIVNFLSGEIVFLEISEYQGIFHNGELYDTLGYVRLKGDALTIDSRQHALTPFFYMDNNTRLFLTNRRNDTPGIATILELDFVQDQIYQFLKKYPYIAFSSNLRRMVLPQLMANPTINIQGGMLLQGLDARHGLGMTFNMSSGNWVLMLQNASYAYGNTIKNNYNITGGIITNAMGSGLYIEGGTVDNYRKFGTTNIADLPLLATGLTSIGKADLKDGEVISRGYVDWQDNYLTQEKLTIHKESGFKTSNINRIRADIVNDGYLDIYGKEGQVYTNYNNITTNYLDDPTVDNRLVIHNSITNMADIKQKLIKIESGAVLTNNTSILAPVIITNQLDNQGKVVLNNGAVMTVAKVGTLGNIDLFDGSTLKAYADKVSATINASGNNINFLALHKDGEFDGTINIGAADNTIGKLEFKNGIIGAANHINIYDNGRLRLGDGSKLELSSNDIYNGSIVIDNAILEYDRVNQGKDAKLYLKEKGVLTLGNGQDASTLKLNADSQILGDDDIKLTIKNKSQLVLNSKDALVYISASRGDVWSGAVQLNNGTLNLIGSKDDDQPIVYNGLLNTQAGNLNIKANSILDMAAGSRIDVNTKVDVQYKSQLKINQGSSVSLNGGTVDVADSNSGIVALDGGELTLRNMDDLVNNMGDYSQTSGTLFMNNSSLTIGTNDQKSVITGGSIYMSDSTLTLQDKGNSEHAASIHTSSGKNAIKIQGEYNSKLNLLAGSYVDATFHIGEHGELNLMADSQANLVKGSKWEGIIKIDSDKARLVIMDKDIKSATGKIVMSKGKLDIRADHTLVDGKDQISGGEISIDRGATLDNNAGITAKLLSHGHVSGTGKLDSNLLLNYEGATISQDTINIIDIMGSLNNWNKNDNAITVNNMSIGAYSKLFSAANALNIANGLKNDGVYYVRGGSMKYDVNGAGGMVIEAQTSFDNSSIQQKTLEVNAALAISKDTSVKLTDKTTNNNTINNAGLLDTVLNNNGAIIGTGSLTLHGNSYNSNKGTIVQDKLSVQDGNFVNKNTTNDSLSADYIQIAKGATLQSNAAALQLTNNGHIDNAGTVKLGEGTLDASIRDLNNTKGVLYIDGKVTLAADAGIESAITVSRGNTLTVADAKDILYGADNNLGKIILQSGTLADGMVIRDQERVAHGSVIIDGDVTNKGAILQQVTINQDKSLHSDIAGLGSTIDNAGRLYLSGSEIKAKNTISGAGDLFIQDDILNNAAIEQDNIYIADNKILTNNAEITAKENFNFSGTLNNQGVVTAVLNNVSTITNDNSGKGTLNIKGQSSNAAQAIIKQQQINLDAAASLKNDGKIEAALDSYAKITGDGEITLTGNSLIGADVSNKINNLVANQKLTVSGENITLSGDIVNSGTIAFDPRGNGIEIDGTIDSTSITDRGKIELNTVGKVHLNATVSNQDITLNNGTLILGSTGHLNGSNLTLGGAMASTDYGSGRLDLSSGDGGALRELTVQDLTVNTDRAASGLIIDVDLENSNNDKILVAGIASTGSDGELNLHAVNIVKDFAEGASNTTITLVGTVDSGQIDAGFKIAATTMASDSGKYQFTQNQVDKGNVDVNKIGDGISLLEAIRDQDITAYSLTKNDYSGQLDALAGTERNLTIFGNNHTINGQGNRGLTVGDKQELVIKDATITGYQGTDAYDGYAITNNGLTYLEGVNLTGNLDAADSKVDIFNTGELYFQGKDSTLAGGIQGNGNLYISGANVDVLAGGSIRQDKLTISVSGGLSIAADGLYIDDLTNNGVLQLQDGKLSQTIKGDGNTYIAGNVNVADSNNNILQDIYVMDTGELHINAANFDQRIDNDGVLVMGSGTLQQQQIIEGGGKLQIVDDVTSNTFINQGTVEIGKDKTLNNMSNAAMVVNKELLNLGILNNTGSVLAQLNNQAAIQGDGKLTVAGVSSNSGTIAQDDIIVKDGVFTNTNTNKDVITAANGITISSTGAFVTNATAVGSQVNNDGVFQLVDGTLSQVVDGTGTVVATGTVVNDTTINQAAVLVQTGSLSNNIGKTIDAKIGVKADGILNASVDDLLQSVYNDGTYNITGGTEINRDILSMETVTGTLNLSQNMQNNADILQHTVNLNSTELNNQGRIQATLNVDSAAILNSSASSIMGKVNNDGVYNVQGGLIGSGYDIIGSGTVNILENTLNQALIEQSVLNVTGNNIFSSNASNIQTKVANEGIYQVTGGSILYTVTGSGSLQVIEGDVYNEANIEQHQVAIESKLTNSAGTQIQADELSNFGVFENNGNVIANLANAALISGKGHMELHGESINAKGASITQGTIDITADNELFNYGKIAANQLTVNQGALLYSNADGMSAKVLNNGSYQVDGGTVAYDITTDSAVPSGQMFIIADAANIANISQKDLLNSADTTFANRGSITVSNLLQNDGQMLNSGVVNGDLLNNEQAMLANNGVLNIELTNLGTVSGNGNMQLHGVSINKGMISQGSISVSGEGSWLVNNNKAVDSITAGLLTISTQAGLHATADSINARIANDGTYDLQGGTIKQQIFGSGNLNIWADTTNNALVSQGNIYLDAGITFTNNLGKTVNADLLYVSEAREAQDIDAGTTIAAKDRAVLIANASDILSTVYNEGLYRVQGGSINRAVIGNGDLLIQGMATNNALIDQTNVTIETAKSLNNTSTIIADAFINQGVLANNGLVLTMLENQGTITGNGNMILNADKSLQTSSSEATDDDTTDKAVTSELEAAAIKININKGVIVQNSIELKEKGTFDNYNLVTAQAFKVNKQAILNSSADNLVATVQNEGTYNLSGGTIYNPIFGQGTLNLQKDTINLSSVSQGLINIDSNVNINNEGVLQTPGMEELLPLYAVDDILGSTLDDKIKELTNSTDGNLYSINNNGSIRNNGIILGSVDNKGNITGSGILQLVGTSKSVEDVNIHQSLIYFRPYATLDFKNQSYRSLVADLITIQDEGSLTANAFAVGAPIINDGIYNIVGAAGKPNVIDYDILTTTGRGQININVADGARVVNDANILQAYVDINYGELFNNEGKVIVADIEISEDSDGKEGTLTANASDIIGRVYNRGTYNIQGAHDGGIIAYSITGSKARQEKSASGEDMLFGKYTDANGVTQSVTTYIKEESDSLSQQRVVYTYTDTDGSTREKEIAYSVIKGADDQYSYVFADTPGENLSSDEFDEKLLAMMPKDIDMRFEQVYDGELNIKSSTIASSIIMQDKVNVSANVELMNNGQLYANSLFSRGVVHNNSIIEAQIDNYGLIDGRGTILAKTGSITHGNITNEISIDKDATMTVAGYAEIYGHINNNSGSTLNLKGNAQGVILVGGVSTNMPGAAAGLININEGDTSNNRATISGDILNQNITLHYGTLNLVDNPHLDGVSLDINSGTLSLQDKSTSVVSIDRLESSGASLNFDLGDKLALAEAKGKLSLGSVLIDTTGDYSNPVQLFTAQSMEVEGTVKTFTNKAVYEITQNANDKQYLDVAKTGLSEEQQHDVINLALKEATEAGKNSTTVQVSGDLLQNKDILDNLPRWEKLYIVGDIQDDQADRLIGSNIKGFKLSQGAELNIRNISEISGFSADKDSRVDGGFAANYGTILITSEYPGIFLNLKNNYAREYGGAVANYSANSLYAIGTIFNGNMVGIGGGAVANYVKTDEHAKSELSYTSYIANKAGYNSDGTVRAAVDGKGGAFYNYTDDTSNGKLSAVADLDSASFKNNTATAMGGAVYNSQAANATGYAVIRLDNTLFEGNRATGSGASGIGQGGAIYNGANATIWSDYLTTADAIIQDIGATGGPTKFTAGDINITSAQFIGNSAKTDGGAIYNANSGALNLTDVWFINNTAEQGKGGAIYTKGNTISITASTVNVNIYGNTADGKSNAIYMDCANASMPASINLKAQNSKGLLLDDTVEIANVISPIVVNINSSILGETNDGTIILGKDYKLLNSNGNFQDAEYILSQGKLYIGSEANFSGTGNNALTMAGSTTLNSINQSIGTIRLDKLTTTGIDPYITLGVDLGANEVDQLVFDDKSQIAANTIFNIGLIDVSLVPDALRNSYGKLADLGSTDAEYALDGSLNGKIFNGKIFDRKLTMSNDTLNFEFVRFNQSILAASVAAQGTYMAQLNSYEQVFENMEPLMNMSADRRAQIKAHAARENTLWFKPYSSYEDMVLNNGPKAKNNVYGGFLGVDSPIQSYANGWDAVYSVYAGFNTGDNSYENTKLKQNGVNVGAAATFFKGNFHTALTANIGYNNATAETLYGSDHFHTLSFGIAAKFGYNIPTGKFTIQPNLQVSYTNIGTANYKNVAGIDVSSSRMNAVQIAPGLKIMANLPNGWKPYVGVQRVWTHGGATSFYAEDVELPSMSVKPYYQYNLGLQKDYGDKFSGGASLAMSNGGRKGVAFQANLRWMF